MSTCKSLSVGEPEVINFKEGEVEHPMAAPMQTKPAEQTKARDLHRFISTKGKLTK